MALQDPATVGTLLARQPADGRRIGALPDRLECGEDETLDVAADGEVVELRLRPEQSGVGTRRLFGGQQPRREVRPTEVRRIGVQRVGVQDQEGQLTRTVGAAAARDRDERIGVGLHVGQGRLRGCGVMRRGQSEDAVRRERERAADAAVGGLLALDPFRRGLRRRELWDLGLRRRGAGRHCGRRQRAEASSVARPTAEAPRRVRRMMCMVLASRTSTRKTPHPRGLAEPRSLCLDGGNSSDLEVSRLMVSPRRRTIHGCGPAPDSHRLPLTGSTATACVAGRTVPRRSRSGRRLGRHGRGGRVGTVDDLTGPLRT